MTTTTEAVQVPSTGARRNEKVGQVVSTKMQKTIVVEVEMATWCASARPVR